MMTTRRLVDSNLGALILASWLSTSCGGDASLGNDQGGLESNGTGGVSGVASGGSQSSGKPSGGSTSASGAPNSSGQGGTSATGGANAEGGALAETGGAETGGVSGATSGGTSSGGKASGGNASGGRASGGAASGGKASGGNASGGTASTGGASGGNVNPADSLTDPNTTGSAECAGTSLAELIAAVHEKYPELAGITGLHQQDAIGDGDSIYAFESGNGFRLVFVHGSGDCPAGCIDREYWYLETDTACAPTQVGHYSRIFDGTGNCYRLTGTPLWNLPTPNQAGKCP